jgi:hypothetical protein
MTSCAPRFASALSRSTCRTLTIALVVGTVLTAINQADVIARGDATATTLVKAVLNYVVPFIVSNLGLLVGTRDERSPQ